MRPSHANIDRFLSQIPGHDLTEKVRAVQRMQQTQGYLCPSAKDLAVHLILELYDSASSSEANATRIASGLELAVDQLRYLSRCIQAMHW